MLKLYTSYYANMKNIPANYLMVGISQYCPEWLKDDTPDNFIWTKGNFLAPGKDLVNDMKSGKIDQKTFTERYTNKFYDMFRKSSEFKSVEQWHQAMDEEFSDKYEAIVFLCYEKPSEFCHRHILREILNYNHHLRTEEYPYPEERKVEDVPKVKALF